METEYARLRNADGSETILYLPVLHSPGRWLVKGENSLTGETTDKVFRSSNLGLTWLQDVTGKRKDEKPINFSPPGGTRANSDSNKADTDHLRSKNVSTLNFLHGQRDDKGRVQARAQADRGINIRSVAEVLADYGLDPFAEVAKIMTKVKPMTDRESGQHVIDPETGEVMMEHVLDDALRAKVALELGQYVKPKLKSIEMKVEDNRELNEDQIDAKIAKLLAKAKAANQSE